MREEINYLYACFTLVIDSEDKSLVLYILDNERKEVANKRFDNEVEFKEHIASLKSNLQNLNDKAKELKNA